ncbi:sulfatase [Lentisphaera marina]|uniref:sulfatase n=1 Tax=Lentisphaera marina TaxID=1111041 RepID=UPI0023656042|nr:sulfatase [Lentisphaera marina]MDD7986429.1 sulfatase [Lentisphaera marina]
MINIKTLVLSFCALVFHTSILASSDKPNVLFIAVDDLVPRLGVYGDKLAKSPHIDRMAARGTTFLHAQCQYPVCGPSRASIMSGLRPESAGVLDLKTKWREANPNIVSLPQYLKEHGYFTTGTGKIYDYRCVDNLEIMDKESWSEAFSFRPGLSSKDVEQIGKAEANQKRKNIEGYTYKYSKVAAAPINKLVDFRDYRVAQEGIKRMRERAAADEPFFLAVGFAKPHLPFYAPKKYWDLYKRDQFEIHPFQKQAAGNSGRGYGKSSELRVYEGIPKEGEATDFSPQLQKELIHGYYACVSYIDFLVGMLTDELKRLKLDDNTIIILWGDHGFHLGDHGQWAKNTSFEQAARAPLIIVDPRQSSPGTKSKSPAEFTDVFPTLCDLIGLPKPDFLQGESLAPVLEDPKAKPREGAVTIRKGWKDIGYSVRNERYRYIEWVHTETKKVIGRDLFDYQKDPDETQNQAMNPEYTKVLEDMTKILHNDSAGLKLLQESLKLYF